MRLRAVGVSPRGVLEPMGSAQEAWGPGGPQGCWVLKVWLNSPLVATCPFHPLVTGPVGQGVMYVGLAVSQRYPNGL